MRSILNALCIVLILALTGCAWGRKINYQGISSFSNPKLVGKFGFAMRDLRPYVLDGSKTPQWVGLSRNLYGIPFGVHTESGQPLATDLGNLVSDTLRRNGADVESVSVPARASAAEVGQAYSNVGAPRGILFDITQWRTDAAFSTGFDFDVSAQIISKDGGVEGQTRYTGARVLSGKQHLSEVVTEIFSKILNAPELGVQQVAQTASNSHVAKPAKVSEIAAPARNYQNTCSADQILKMRDLGISSEQIKAACK